MDKILVIPTEDKRLYIHPDTHQEFPSGKVVETEEDWFVKAKLNMKHLRLANEEEAQKFEEEKSQEPLPPADEQPSSPLSLEAFADLKPDEQKKELVRLGLAAAEKDEAVSNEEKRLAMYEGFLNGAGE